LNAEANYLQVSEKPKLKSSYVFIQDDKRDRTFLLDTGANGNMIDASVLTPQELAKMDTTKRVPVANFESKKDKLQSIGETIVEVPYKNTSLELKFIVMPARSMNYNLIGVVDILKHFIPLLEELGQKQKAHDKARKFQSEVNVAQAIPERNGEVLTEEEAQAYLETLPTPKCPEEPKQKDVMDQEWFAKVWNLFPRLQAEKQNLQEDSRLPYKCKVELHDGASLFFTLVYQLSEKSTSEMTRFLKDAEEKA